MTHAEGKLEVVTDCPGKCCWHIQRVGNTDEFHRITSLEMGEEDARRLVACWNYCIGMSIEHLEAKHDWKIDARILVTHGELVRAVKHCRAMTGWGLKEAVDAVRALQSEIPETTSL